MSRSAAGGSEPPAEIVIDDLADPRFSPEVAEMMALAAPMADALELTAGGGPRAGRRPRLGLDDFGGDGFREPLARAARQPARRGRVSARSARSTSTPSSCSCAKNRLLVQDLLTRHPEIRDIEIVAPIIVAGLPRTGTTHLHNLLSADPALRSLPYWESIEPVAPPSDGGDPADARARGGRGPRRPSSSSTRPCRTSRPCTR